LTRLKFAGSPFTIHVFSIWEKENTSAAMRIKDAVNVMRLAEIQTNKEKEVVLISEAYNPQCKGQSEPSRTPKIRRQIWLKKD
jgi:hypothetical protein